MQLNASPRTDGAGDTQLQSTLPTMSQASSTAPLTATKPLLLRAWLQAPFPPSCVGDHALLSPAQQHTPDSLPETSSCLHWQN